MDIEFKLAHHFDWVQSTMKLRQENALMPSFFDECLEH
jgi:hypothetical protein